MDYLVAIRDKLCCVHELKTRKSLADAGIKQRRLYNTRSWGRENVWVYSPGWKRGLSPKLMSHWVGPCTVLAWLADIVYWVRLAGWARVVVLPLDRLPPYQPHVGAYKRCIRAATERPSNGQSVSPPASSGIQQLLITFETELNFAD